MVAAAARLDAVRDCRNPPRRAAGARRRSTPAAVAATSASRSSFEARLPAGARGRFNLAPALGSIGRIQLGLLALWRIPLGPFGTDGFVFLVAGCGLVVIALDRYAANFVPTPERLWIIAALLTGAVPFFVADARLSHRASIGRRLFLHGMFLASLVFAVALDFEGLFFLLMIAPVIVLFYLVFGSMGHAVSARSGPVAAGLALGLVLALALGVSFPLFEA